MKKRKIIIVNRGSGFLHMHCAKCKQPGEEKFKIRNRKVIRLNPGTYKLQVYYQARSVVLESSMNGTIRVEDIVSPLDNRYTGKRLTVTDEIARLKIFCREQFSIASILEGVEEDRKPKKP